jgi:hypothetical protein
VKNNTYCYFRVHFTSINSNYEKSRNKEFHFTNLPQLTAIMKKVATKNFTSQIDQVIERHKALLDMEWQKLISQSSADGMVQSGGFVKQSFDLANVSIISVVDDSLKFTLHYADSEKLALNDLID